jgi:hypothetical protein
MSESPQFMPEWIMKTAWGEKAPTVPTDPLWIRKIEEFFKDPDYDRNMSGMGYKDIVWNMSGMEYKYIFIKTANGWSISEERRGEDGTIYYKTVNMRAWKYELFKNQVTNGNGSPGKIPLTTEGVKGILEDFLSNIHILRAGKQVSWLEDTIAFA